MSLRLGRLNYNHYYSMKKKSAFHSVRRNFHEGGFFKLRVLFGVLLCFAGVDDCSVCAGQSLSTTTDIDSPTQCTMEQTPCGEQDRAVGDGTHC